MKKRLLLCSVLFIVCFVSLAFIHSPASASITDTGKITFKPAEGFDEKAVMSYATYFFAEGNDWSLDEKIAMVNLCELVLGMGKSAYGLTFMKPDVFFVNDVMDFEISRGKIVLCPTDTSSLGTITSYASYGRLPAWLCAGFELYAMELTGYPFLELFIDEADISEWVLEQEAGGLPGFGDAWMIPGFIKSADGLHNGVPYICLEFTRYLIDNETDGLAGIVKELLKEQAWPTFEPLQEYWVDFTRNTGKLGCEYSYAYGRFSESLAYIGPEKYDIVFVYYSPRTRIECVDYKEIDWHHDEINDYAAHIERSIDYVLDWLELDYDFIEHGMINVVINRIFIEDSVNYYETVRGGIFLTNNNSSRIIVYAATHELAHFFTYKTGITTDNTVEVFIEGLPQLIQTETEWGNELDEYLFYRKTLDNLLFHRNYTKMGRSFTEYFESRIGKLYAPLEPLTLEMIYVAWDWLAAEQLSGRQRITSPLYSQDAAALMIEIVNFEFTSYAQAASFTHFLYATYGKEKLLGAYSDYHDIEKLYGKTYGELVGEWKSYLGIQEDLAAADKR